MKKISKKTYRGIDYVQLSALPVPHVELLKQSLNERTLIKILKNDIVLNDCVLYSAYEKWFASHHSIQLVTPVVQPATVTFTDPLPVA